MVQSGEQTLEIYYFEERLAFNDQDVATLFLLVGIAGVVAQVVVLKPLCELVGEKMVVSICFIVGSLKNVAYGLARDKIIIFVSVTIGALGAMAFPTISAIKANNVVRSFGSIGTMVAKMLCFC